VFIGHFAVAFAAKKVAPKASLGMLVFAAVFLDAVWPVLVLLGIERFRIVPGYTAINPFEFLHYPWSHSLLMTAVWALLLAFAYRAAGGDRTGEVWVGIAVASHWVLDFITHRPDLPLYPGGGQRFGLSLWNSLPATFAVEGMMFALAVALYTRITRPKDRTGAIAWWALIVLLVVLYVTGPFSPPPPSENAVAIAGIMVLLIVVPWAWWIDRHRELKTGGS